MLVECLRHILQLIVNENLYVFVKYKNWSIKQMEIFLQRYTSSNFSVDTRLRRRLKWAFLFEICTLSGVVVVVVVLNFSHFHFMFYWVQTKGPTLFQREIKPKNGRISPEPLSISAKLRTKHWLKGNYVNVLANKVSFYPKNDFFSLYSWYNYNFAQMCLFIMTRTVSQVRNMAHGPLVIKFILLLQSMLQFLQL